MINVNPCVCGNSQVKTILDQMEDEITSGYRTWCESCGLMTNEVKEDINESRDDWNNGLVKYNTQNTES